MKVLLTNMGLACWTIMFSQSNEKLSHYLYPQFEQATVRMINGNVNKTMMNYNTVTEEMIFDQNGSMLAIANIVYVDTIFLNNAKFIPRDGKFFELVHKATFSFFIQNKRKLSSAGKPVGYGGTSQTASVTSLASLQSSGGIYKLNLPDEWLVTEATVYWIKTNDNWHSFVNERQLLKIFPDKAEDLKAFLKKNRIDLEKREDLVKLAAYINGM